MKNFYKKTIVITGGTSGIGLAAAELFASNGYTVFALSRRAEEGCRTTGGGCIYTYPCDVCSDASIDAAYTYITSITKDIGILLHSAGFGISGAAEDTSLADAEAQMNTNYLGVLRVNRRFMPLMRAAKNGLVLVIGSVAGLISIPFQSHYSASKFALEAYVEALRMECAPFGIRAALIEPGDTKTAFTGARAKNTAYLENSPYGRACDKAVAKMEQDEKNGKSPESAAKVALSLSKKKNPPVRAVVGVSYKTLVFLKRIMPARVVLFLVKKMYCG